MAMLVYQRVFILSIRKSPLLSSYSLKRVGRIKGTPFPVGLVGRTERETSGSLRSSLGPPCPENIGLGYSYYISIYIYTYTYIYIDSICVYIYCARRSIDLLGSHPSQNHFFPHSSKTTYNVSYVLRTVLNQVLDIHQAFQINESPHCLMGCVRKKTSAQFPH